MGNMLKSFSVTDYRKFSGTVTLNLASPREYTFNANYVNDGIIRNALVIGPNASGKTNLIRAIADVRTNYYPPDSLSTSIEPDPSFVNADAASQEALFSYCFDINGHSVIYAYSKGADRRLTEELLSVDGAIVFKYFNAVDKLVESDFDLVGAAGISLRFSGEYSSLLAFLTSNASVERDGILSSLRRLTAQIVPILHEGGSAAARARIILSEVIRTNRVEELEAFLARFGVQEKLSVHEDADGSKSLYCVHRRLIPFSECMSSGTRTLLSIFSAYEMHPQGAVYLLDEFDAYCHFEVAEQLIRYFGSVSGCQTISTTHNTSLTRNDVMRPDCIFKFGSDGSLKALSERTSRELRIGNNVEKLLRNGEFD